MNKSLLKQILRENGVAITQAPPAAQKDALFYYFFHGDRKFTTAGDFLAQWRRIPDFDFKPKQLVNILQKTKHHLDGGNFPLRRDDFIAGIANHWHCWENEAFKKIGSFIPQDICMTLGSAASMRILPREAFIEACFARAQETAQDFTSQNFSNFLHACATFGASPDGRLLKTFIHHMPQIMTGASNQDIANSVWATAALHTMTGDPLYEEIFSGLKQSAQKICPTLEREEHKKQIHDAFLWFAGGNKTPTANPARQETISLSENTMIRMLRDLGYDVNADIHPIPVLAQAIDFALHSRGQRILFEVDGPCHYLLNTEDSGYTLDGHTRFRTALCHQQAPSETIMRLPFLFCDEWMEKRNRPEQQRAIMESLIGKARYMGPGAYNAALNRGRVEMVPLTAIPCRNEQLASTAKQSGQVLRYA